MMVVERSSRREINQGVYQIDFNRYDMILKGGKGKGGKGGGCMG